MLEDLPSGTSTGKSLQQLLQDEPSRQDRVPTFKRTVQGSHLWRRRGVITTEGKRPDAGIDEQAHLRDRSAL